MSINKNPLYFRDLMFYNCNHFSSTIFFRLYNIWGNSSGYACARTYRDDSPITITAIESISYLVLEVGPGEFSFNVISRPPTAARNPEII